MYPYLLGMTNDPVKVLTPEIDWFVDVNTTPDNECVWVVPVAEFVVLLDKVPGVPKLNVLATEPLNVPVLVRPTPAVKAEPVAVLKVILAVPSNGTPLILRAVANLVAVAALPEMLPVIVEEKVFVPAMVCVPVVMTTDEVSTFNVTVPEDSAPPPVRPVPAIMVLPTTVSRSSRMDSVSCPAGILYQETPP